MQTPRPPQLAAVRGEVKHIAQPFAIERDHLLTLRRCRLRDAAGVPQCILDATRHQTFPSAGSTGARELRVHSHRGAQDVLRATLRVDLRVTFENRSRLPAETSAISKSPRAEFITV